MYNIPTSFFCPTTSYEHVNVPYIRWRKNVGKNNAKLRNWKVNVVELFILCLLNTTIKILLMVVSMGNIRVILSSI